MSYAWRQAALFHSDGMRQTAPFLWSQNSADADQSRLLAALLDHASESIIAYDCSSRIVFWNEASEALYGWSSCEVIGRTWRELTCEKMASASDSASERAGLHKIWRRHKTGRDLQLTIRRENLPPMAISTSVGATMVEYAHLDTGGIHEGARGLGAARLRIETQLKQVETEFAHAARISTLGEMVSSIAHELRQPLSVISTDGDTTLRWLSREEPNLPKVRSIIERMLESARRAGDIINRIKEMAVKHAPEVYHLDVHTVLMEAAKIVGRECSARSVRLSYQLAEGSHEIAGDSVQLQQVIVNLLMNAMQAIDASGTARREIHIATVRRENEIEISIRDTGPGIAPSDIGRIFEPYFSTKRSGMGLGLAICRTIVEAHGGSISASQLQGGGAMFAVILPTVNSEHAAVE